jgi:hypothetical protein
MKGLVVRVKVKRQRVDRLKGYLKENWGAPFIVAFMAMLIACASALAYGNEALANEVAIYAYYLLVVGVALQLASFIREGRRKKSFHGDESHPR